MKVYIHVFMENCQRFLSAAARFSAKKKARRPGAESFLLKKGQQVKFAKLHK